MSLHMIVDYLQDGIRNDLKLHVKRRLKTLTDAPTPAMFLKIARDEEELQNEVSSESNTLSFLLNLIFPILLLPSRNHHRSPKTLSIYKVLRKLPILITLIAQTCIVLVHPLNRIDILHV